MARFVIEEVPSGRGIVIPTEVFVQVVIGQSITSFADWGAKMVEFGLSARMNMRVMHAPDGLEISLVSTVNPGETAPVVFQLPGEGGRPVDQLAQQLSALGELYAFAVLSDAKEGDERLLRALESGASFSSMLVREEQLFIQAVTPGSVWVTAWTAVKDNYQRLAGVVHLVFPQLREAYLRRVEAETKVRELDAERKAFELQRDKINAVIDIREKLAKDPSLENGLRDRLAMSVTTISSGTGTQTDVDQAVQDLMNGPG